MKVRAVFPVGIMLILLLGVSSSFAQQYEDVVYLKDGGVRRGLILEQIPGESLKLETSYGEIFVISMSDISKIAKEEKPTLVATIDNTPGKVSGVKLESWYTYWGLGYANMSYTDELKAAQECTPWESESESGVALAERCESFSMSFDLFGFYWPLKNKQTIIGPVLNMSAENQSYILWDETTISHQISASVMHFFQSPIGKGPFIRADLGLSDFDSVTTEPDFSHEFPELYRERDKYPGKEGAGAAFLLGVGYGFPIGNGGTRILTTLSYAQRPGPQGMNRETGERHPKGMVKIFGMTFGGLF